MKTNLSHVDHTFKSPAVISFCPGLLGLERGLERAGCSPRVVAYVEIEAFIIANLVAGMESGVLGPAPIWTDAKTFDASPFRGKIHGIIGGYPCPGESLAGLREGHLYKGFIWPAIRRAIAAARPVFCFFENVDDHLTGTFPIVHRSLRNMGYAVEAGVFSAEEAGAPHERQRLFILAVEHTYVAGLRRQYPGGLYSEAVATSKKLADTGHDGMEKPRNNNFEEANVETKQNCSVLANTNSQRKQIQANGRFAAKQGVEFPAPQGCDQYPWEEPRTIEPGLGCTINGYNFKEDLLRALGNSVVEQTAQIAFLTLLKKLGIHI